MADTVSNHFRGVCTKGTSHVATSDPLADVCWLDKGHKKKQGFDNFCPSKHLKSHATTKNTYIDGQFVWIDRSLLDDGDSFKAKDGGGGHDGVGGGVVSHTYMKYACASNWSKDLQLEGGWAVRSFDPTYQNGQPTSKLTAKGVYNCAGKVLPADPNADAEAQDEFARKRCKIKSFVVKCSHGRTIDTVKNETELGVVGDESGPCKLTAKTERIAQGPPEEPSPCKLHSQYEAERVVTDHSPPPAPITEEHTGDDWELPEEIIADPMGPWKLHESGAEKGVRSTEKGEDGAVTAGKEAGSKHATLGANAMNLEADFEKLVAYLMFKHSPTMVHVRSLACAGAENAIVKLYPAEPIEFKIASWDSDVGSGLKGPPADVMAVLKDIHETGRILKKVGDLFGKASEIGFDIMSSAELGIKTQFKELTKDENKLHKYQANNNISLTIAFNPVFKAWAELDIPLLEAAGPLGALAEKAIEYFGLKGVFFIRGEISFSISLVASIDEYNYPTLPNSEFKLVCTVSMGVEVDAGESFGLKADGYAKAEVTLGEFSMGGQTAFLSGKLNGSIKLGIEFVVHYSVLGWEGSRAFNFEPECAQWKLHPAKDLHIIPWKL
jgi:hypothetical protein